MTVFAAAMDRVFANTSMAAAALWISATTSEERPIRVIRRAPDRITDFGAGRFVSDTMMVDVRVSEAIARRVLLDWEGVGDADGNPVPVTPAGIDALLDVWPVFEAFQAGYVARAMLLEQEKNGFAPSPTGTSAAAQPTARVANPARPAKGRAKTARRG